MPDLRLTGLSKRYGSTVAADRVSLQVDDREFVTLLGPSGSGKTTVLRLIAGYIEPDMGSIMLGGRELSHLPPEKRDIGMVFQHYALFPHMTVFDNVAFGLDRRRIERGERNSRVSDALAMVRLTGLEKRFPRELSGGQQQRVALARAIVIRPTLLLLDEPLSNLDAKLRAEVRLEIRRIQREIGITTVLVTHDQEEALSVSDRIAVMNHGRIEQVATAADLYFRPASRFVADFVGRMNFLAAELVSGAGEYSRYRLRSGDTVLAPGEATAGLLAVRPEALTLGSPPPDPDVNSLAGTLEYRVLLGELAEFGVRLSDGSQLAIRASNVTPFSGVVGSEVRFWWRAAAGTVFAENAAAARA